MFVNSSHIYLQNECTKFNSTYKIPPRILNRCLQRALHFPSIENKPIKKSLELSQPNVDVQNCDVTRRFVGFGRIGLLKLRRDLHDKDVNVRIAALTSISDLIHNSENLYMMLKLNVVDRLIDLTIHIKDEIRERTLIVLCGFATVNDGKLSIIKRLTMIRNLKLCLKDGRIEVRFQVARLLTETSSYWESALILTENTLIKTILERIPIEPDEILIYHLKTLKNLLYCNGKCVALQSFQAFPIIVQYLEGDNLEIVAAALACLMELMSLKEGRTLANDIGFLTKIKQWLYHENPEVHTYAAGVLMNVTIKLKIIVKASNFSDLLPRLLRLAQSRMNSELQVYSIKAILNLTQYPDIRKLLKTTYAQEYAKIKASPDLVYLKRQLDTALFET